MKQNQILKDIDGHLEKPIKAMTTKEKLDFIWNQILMWNSIKTNVKKK